MAATRKPLPGKVVAITGAARGIGRATAEAFLERGAAVAIGDLDAELVGQVAHELEEKYGARIVGLPLDVTDEESFTSFLQASESALAPPDVLVNNAGIMPTGLFLDEDPAMTRRQVDINVHGVLTGSRLAAERFTARGSGHVVNVASLAGILAEPGLATYCGTKHFVLGFSESLHLEMLPHGVGVTAILPGVVRTELGAGAKLPAWLARLATVDPEDVAAGIVRAVEQPRPVTAVPAAVGGLLSAMAALPPRARFALQRLTKLDVMVTQGDAQARAAYEARIAGEIR